MYYEMDDLETRWIAAMDTIERTLREALVGAPDGQVAEFGDDARLLVRRVAMDAVVTRARRHVSAGESVRTIAKLMNVSENRLRYLLRDDDSIHRGQLTNQVPVEFTDLRDLFASLS